jgi:hypothetical protein
MSVRAESEMDLEPFPTSVPKEVLDTVVVGAGLSGMCVGQVRTPVPTAHASSTHARLKGRWHAPTAAP